jgi:hypothetical protein
LAATVFVSFHDLAFVDLLAGSGIMRPKRDPSGGPTLVRIRAASNSRCRLCCDYRESLDSCVSAPFSGHVWTLSRLTSPIDEPSLWRCVFC